MELTETAELASPPGVEGAVVSLGGDGVVVAVVVVVVGDASNCVRSSLTNDLPAVAHRRGREHARTELRRSVSRVRSRSTPGSYVARLVGPGCLPENGGVHAASFLSS